MKLVMASVFMLIFLPVLAGAQVIDFYGYAWEEGTGEIELKLAGKVDDILPPLTWTPSFEYTIYLFNLAPGTTVVQGGGWEHTPYTGGRFQIWEDTTPDLAYGTFPPNATVPLTFVDGTLYLEGDFTTLDVYRNPGIGIGSFQGDLLFTGGTHLIELAVPGWTFGGTTTYSPDLPDGYSETWDGMFYSETTGSEEQTWGGIKALFR